MAKLTQLLQRSGRTLQPMLWRFDQLAEERWREMALRDACRASTVTLAVADELALERAPDTWLHAVVERMHGSTLNVLALIGVDDVWNLDLEQRPRKSANGVRVGRSPALSRPVRMPVGFPAAVIAAG